MRPVPYSAIVLGLLVLAALGCAGPAPGVGDSDEEARPGRGTRHEEPNVFLVVLSSARTDRLSLHGYERPTTPQLERLARQAVVYENCISPGVWVLPTRASMFTGTYLRDHAADGAFAMESTRRGHRALPDEAVLLAEVLRDAGYQTVGLSNNSWLDAHFGLQQGFDAFIPMFPRNPEGDWEDDGARESNERVFEWLDRREHPERPFFFYLDYIEPTMPYAPPEPFAQRFVRAGADPQEVRELSLWRHPREMAYMLGAPGYDVSPEQFEILGDLYDGELAYVDSQLGELAAALDERGLLENTVLIVTADQGEHFGEHGLMHHKMSVYEPLIHVPLVVRYPGLAPTRSTALVQTHDLFPTILKLCGVRYPTPSGARVLPGIDGSSAREYTFAEAADPTAFLTGLAKRYPGADISRFNRSLRTVRGKRYKYIWGSDGTRELYDLVLDPAEQVDLSEREPGLTTLMHGELLRFDRREAP